MIKCPNCGFENDANCTFCAICGSSVIQDDFYVHNTTSNSISVDELNEKLFTKENQKTKSFKKLDKATLAKEAAKIEATNTSQDDVKEYKAKAVTKPQQEPKPTANNKPNAKTDSITENKAENIDNTKADNKIENKDDNKAQNKVDTKANSKVENKANTKVDSNTENKADTKADSKVESNADTKADSKVESKTDAKADSAVKNEADTNNTHTSVQDSTTDSKLYTLLSKFLFDTKNSTKLFKQKDIDENCNLALISYIPFLFFVPMIVKPCSGYVRYHGIQGLTLFIISVVLEFFDILLSAIFTCALNDMPAVICTIIVTVVINLSILLFISTGIANAVKGEARELPIIGKYKLLKQYIY